jgi:diguanylate cyclase (GGDEF)-like protein/PAS domain S-box-containing protein
MTSTLLDPDEGVAPPAPAEAGEAAAPALSEAYFRSLVENARDVIHVINADGTTRYITPSVTHLLGWTVEELVGRNALELVHPDDRGPAVDILREARKTPESGRPLVLRVPHRDGSWRVFEAIGRNLLDDPRVRGVIVNSRDVTERVRAQEETRRLAAFARENPGPILECAPDGRVLYLNPAAERLVAELGAAGAEGVLPPEHARLAAACVAGGESARGVEARVGERVFAWTYHPQGQTGTVHLFGEEVTERKRVEARLRHDTLHDALTGLPNRHLFMERLGTALARRDGTHFAVLFLDLDRFKVVNDSLGHHVGDELLVAVSRRLMESVRGCDTVARFGGDEFTILLQELDDPADAGRIAERIAQAVAAPVNLAGYEVFTSASIGIALSSGGYDRPEYLLRNADMAMYRAKAGTGAPYEVFDRGMHAQALTRLQLENDLRRALARDELRLRFQPIVSLQTGKVVGAEALCRWQHPERGLILPAEFIPTAEETGAVLPLGEWVLREACRALAGWRAEFPEAHLAVSVNLSGRQLARKDLPDTIRAALEAAGLQPRHLKLEITESALMEAGSAEVLDLLRALGAELQLDDFGTGYSSLSRLHRLPMRALKVDRSFVARIREPATAQLVRAIALMARGLELDVIAEGVETPEQLAEVRACGCEYAQGFLFSPPLDPSELRELLASDPRW